MAPLDYYRILGVTPSSTLEEVRQRYRELARRHHPDHNPNDPEAAGRFRLVVEAFEAIMSVRAKARTQARARSRNRRHAAQYRQPRFTDKEQLFEEFFGISQDVTPLAWSAGADFRYDLEIPFVAAIKGMETVIAVDHQLRCRHCGGSGLSPGAEYRPCPDCQGRGRRFGGPGLLRFGPVCEACQGRGKIVAVPCRHCDGLGSYTQTKEYHLGIPPGIRDGARFRLKGEGGAGFHNGPPGNLLVTIHVAPHDIFTRVGNDIYCRIEISLAQASVGGAIRIPTLEGFETVHLPQGTQTGWSFRFFGAGAPGTSQQPPGDQVNEITVTASPELGSPPLSRLHEFGCPKEKPWERAGHE